MPIFASVEITTCVLGQNIETSPMAEQTVSEWSAMKKGVSYRMICICNTEWLTRLEKHLISKVNLPLMILEEILHNRQSFTRILFHQ